jgi:hypothetical protein
MAGQEEAHPELATRDVRSRVWGFGSLRLAGESAELFMLTPPTDGSGTPEPAFEAEFARRSGSSADSER